MSELISEVTIFMKTEKNQESFCEEVADVGIMLNMSLAAYHVVYDACVEQVEIGVPAVKDDIKKIGKMSKTEFLRYFIRCISELQKALCKRARGCKNTDNIRNATIHYLTALKSMYDEKLIEKKMVDEWTEKKLERMNHRFKKNNIF